MLSYKFINGQKIFTYKEQEVLAAGILFYTVINYKDYYLLRKDNSKRNKNHWSDLGGKVDNLDKNIFDTITREVLEETNNEIYNIIKINNNIDCFKKWIENKSFKLIYNRNSKYLIFKINLDFLKKENLEIIKAEDTIVKWKFVNKYTKIRLHPRLKRHYLNN